MATMTPKSLVDAKGDLIAATANDTPARLAVGNNGETLVADSSTSTGLRYQASQAAGKNAIINGGFDIWQRGTSFANPGVFAYFADRFYSVSNNSGGTITLSRQTFTGTDLPVAGAQYYFRNVGASPTGATYNTFGQKIENVQTYAAQTVTVSFWAKADTTRSITPNFYQNFGTGGSSEVGVGGSAISLSTSWVRYSQTFSIPSISGKTIGTGSWLAFEISQPTNVSHTIEYYGIQVELGSVATTFTRAGGTIQGELAACQRYYYRAIAGGAYSVFGGNCSAWSTTDLLGGFNLPVTMRTTPTSVEFSTLIASDGVNNNSISGLTIASSYSNPNYGGFAATSTSLTAFRYYRIQANNSTSAYIAYSAEL
jgi:hypothetical protein